MRYAVTIMPDDNGTFLATFPDVPDAITYGDTIDEALAHARDALLTVVDAYMRERRDIPAPSPIGSGTSIELPPLETAKIELYRSMRDAKVNKAELARRLHWHLPQVDRVLNVRHGSKLDQIDAAFQAIGKRLRISVEDAPAKVRKARVTRIRRPAARSRTRQRVHIPEVSPRVFAEHWSERDHISPSLAYRSAKRKSAIKKSAKKR